MRVLLDTSAYSAFMRGHTKVRDILQLADRIFFNPIVLGELKSGFRRGRRKELNEKLLEQFLESPRVYSVPVNEETSERYAVIRESLWKSGTPIPTNDMWIAATAMQHGLVIVTTDPHYKKVTQILVEYFPVTKS
jgi:predicted nucleic acid-binding protein